MTAGDIPVSGTLNTIQIKPVSSSVDTGGFTLDGGEEKTMYSVDGPGEIRGIHLWIEKVGGLVSAERVWLAFIIDGVGDYMSLWIYKTILRNVTLTPTPITFTHIDDTAQEWNLAFNSTFTFQRNFQLKIKNTAPSGNVISGRAILFPALQK